MKKITHLLIFFCFTVAFSQNGPLDTTFNSTDTGHGNGITNDAQVFKVVVLPDGKTLIVGSFTTINNISRNRIARLHADGTLDTTFTPGAGATGAAVIGQTLSINFVALQTDGKILIAGNFTSYSGTTMNRMARLNQNGTLDTTFNIGTGFNDETQRISIQTDGKILVAGIFSSFNGVTSNRLLRLNSNGSLDTSFSSGTGIGNSTVRSIIQQPDGKLLIGGTFINYNNVPTNDVARLNTDGTLDTTFSSGAGVTGLVYDMALLTNNQIIIVGSFDSYNTITMRDIARLNSNGSLDTTFNPGSGSNLGIDTVAIQSDGKIIIAGLFDTYNLIPRLNIARLNSDASLDLTFNATPPPPSLPINQSIYTVAIQSDSNIVIGGIFSNYHGINRKYVARLTTNGNLDLGFLSGTSAGDSVFSIKQQADGKILIAGNFFSYSDVYKRSFTRLQANGELDPTFNTGIGTNSSVSVIAVQPDGKIIIGGFFTAYNNIIARNIARLNPDGTLDTTFSSPILNSAGSFISTVAVQTDGKIIIGGSFSLTGLPNRTIQRLNANGTLDTTFDISQNPNAQVRTIIIQTDGKILIGGLFTTFGGLSRNYIARLDANGQLDSSFNPGIGPNNFVLCMAIQADGKIIIGGSFSTVNNLPISRVARINADGTLDSSLTVTTTGALGIIQVGSIVLTTENKIVIGGTFPPINGGTSSNIMRLNNDGTNDTTFQIGIGANGTVSKIDIQTDGKLLVGGNFTSYNQIGRNRIARVQNTGLPLALNPVNKNTFLISPNPSTGIFTIQTQNSITNANITVADLNGRIVYETKSENLDNKSLDLSNLQNGIYILNVSNGATKYSQKIIKQ